MPEKDDEGSLEDLILGLGESVLATGTSSSEEYALAIGWRNGVFLLQPAAKRLVQVAGRDANQVCVNEDLYIAFPSLGNKSSICVAGMPYSPESSVSRHGHVAGLRSINGRLYDFGAFAVDTKAYAIFDTLACPTGEELPIAIRDEPITSLFEYKGVIYDISDGKIFNTFSSPTGKEKAFKTGGFVIHDAYFYQGKLYLGGYLEHEKSQFVIKKTMVIGEFEEIRSSGEPIKTGGFISGGYCSFKFFPHEGRLFTGIVELGMVPARVVHVLDCFSDYKTEEPLGISYKTSPLVAKAMGAVPVSEELFDRLLENPLTFSEVARPSMVMEVQQKIEDLYKEAETRFQQQLSLFKDKSKAKRFFGGLRELCAAVVSEYARFGIKQDEVEAGPIENKFKLYEQMVAGAR